MKSSGVRTILDLLDRSRVDEITGCWNVAAAKHKGTSIIWMADYGRTMSLPRAMAYLLTGDAPPKGRMYVPMCGNTACGNPEHRKLGGRSLLMQIMRPTLEPAHRARIARSQQARAAVQLTSDVLCAARSSDLPQYQVAAKLGVHASTLGKALNGGSWRGGAVGSSVFMLSSGVRQQDAQRSR